MTELGWILRRIAATIALLFIAIYVLGVLVIGPPISHDFVDVVTTGAAALWGVAWRTGVLTIAGVVLMSLAIWALGGDLGI